MNIASIKLCDCANGPGMRTSVFVSGCSNHCPGCFNEVAWDYDYGKPLDYETIDYILETLLEDHIEGLSILGGEPLDPKNQYGVFKLVSAVNPCRDILYHGKQIGRSVWLYTGYTWGRIPKTKYTKYILSHIDVLVDGSFIESEKDITLKFRGSRNQRIIDVKKTLEKGEVVVCEGY